MKRRVFSWLMALCMLVLAIAPTGVVLAEEELFFPEIELEVGKKDEETRGEGDELDKLNNTNQGAIGSLAQKDWAAAAAAVLKSGDWRDDLVHVAESQVGYAEAFFVIPEIFNRTARHLQPQFSCAVFRNRLELFHQLTNLIDVFIGTCVITGRIHRAVTNVIF